MKGKNMESQALNPFENDRVDEPRQIEKPVSGFNNKPLEELIFQFERLEKEPLPRKEKLSHAQLIVSPDRGSGKSHLIGRLFQKLSGRATLIYLRPFEDASSCWKSILLKIVQEMRFPDRIDIECYNEDEPNQLEVFAHGILTNLIADAVESGKILSNDKDGTVKALRKISLVKFRSEKLDWINQNFNNLVGQCDVQLNKRGIKLNASALSWLGVLFRYAYFPSELSLRETCVDWLQGGSIDSKDAEKIGIRAKDISNSEISAGETNELCKNRIVDFCQLAGFFRPFVFCFDQTDNYGKDILLSKTLGTVIETLAAECYNQMTVVTANEQPWLKTVTWCWDEAFLDRLSSPPLELKGLNRKQAEELIEHRLVVAGWRFSNEIARKFYDPKWLDELFQESHEIRIRDFLNRCKVRWMICGGDGEIIKPDIAITYKKFVEEIKTQPKRLVFEPNILYWLLYEVGSGLSDLTVEKYKSPKGYFSLVWKLENRQIFFGFESGSHWKRWQAIQQEAGIHHKADSLTKIVMFRTNELSNIPGNWTIKPDIEKAQQEYLNILHLESSEITKLYAAYDLYMDTVEGNLPFQKQEVLNFIRGEVQWFWDKIEKAKGINVIVSPPITHPQKELIQEIRNIVQSAKFLSVSDAIERLSTPVSEELFHEAREHIPEIKFYVTPMNTVLQWQSK